MLNLMIGLLTLLSVMLIVYHHLGYPLLLRLLGKKVLIVRRRERPIENDNVLPRDLRHRDVGLRGQRVAGRQ